MTRFQLIQGGKGSAGNVAQLRHQNPIALVATDDTAPGKLEPALGASTHYLGNPGAESEVVKPPTPRKKTNAPAKLVPKLTDDELRKRILSIYVAKLAMDLGDILKATITEFDANPEDTNWLAYNGALIPLGIFLYAASPEHEVAVPVFYEISASDLFFKVFPEYLPYKGQIRSPAFFLA